MEEKEQQKQQQNEPQDDDDPDDQEEDHFTMPPPRPRRPRSVSNPEDMMTYDATAASRSSAAAALRNCSNRRCLVLPACILENELAEAAVAVEEFAASAASSSCAATDNDNCSTADEDPDTMLQRARARLLEDLAEPHSSSKQQRGELILPHSLSKYKEVRVVSSFLRCVTNLVSMLPVTHNAPFVIPFHSSPPFFALTLHLTIFSVSLLFCCVALLWMYTHGCAYILQVYNRHGRIGIYTRAERAAILARFHDKRTRRNWQKKIRYNCRKSLADSRRRVKGRFVKKTTQAQPLVVADQPQEEETTTSRLCSDDDMPDVNDPEAGFCPTEDQPYRRLRRHTVT